MLGEVDYAAEEDAILVLFPFRPYWVGRLYCNIAATLLQKLQHVFSLQNKWSSEINVVAGIC